MSPLHHAPVPQLTGYINPASSGLGYLANAGDALVMWDELVPALYPIGGGSYVVTISGMAAYFQENGVTAYGCLWSSSGALVAASPAITTPTGLGWVPFPIAWQGLYQAIPGYIGFWLPGGAANQVPKDSTPPVGGWWGSSASSTPTSLPASQGGALNSGWSIYYNWHYPQLNQLKRLRRR
jgi:hypothetical protein